MPHPSQLPIDQLLKACEFTRTRRGGPGGQHRNKVETAVVAVHRPSGVRAEAAERRSQADNRRAAIFRLRLRLAVEIRTPPTDAPSRLWQSRVVGGRIQLNPEHDDFPAMLAECLNVVADENFDVAAAGERLGVSTSQLMKLLKRTPAALDLVNNNRILRKLRPLR